MQVHSELRQPRPRWRLKLLPTRSDRAILRSTAQGAAAPADWETSDADWAARSPSPRSSFEKLLGVAPAHLFIALALCRLMAKITPSIDHLFRRSATDAELQPPTGDEIGCARILHHIVRILVTHVDHGGADLDALGLCADGREQRERRCELAGEVVDTEVGSVRSQPLGLHGKIDGLQERVGCRLRVRLR